MVRKYFGMANSAGGLANLMDNNLSGLKTIYTISGDSKKQKTEILDGVLKKAEMSGDVECVISPFDIKCIDAVIIRSKGPCVVDRDCLCGEIAAKNIDLDGENQKRTDISEKEKWAIGKMYKCYDDAKKIHDEWEKIYMKNMDYDKLEAYEKGVLDQLFAGQKGLSGKKNYHRFFGSSTPDGAVNYIDNLTENLAARYFIKGRAGTGKSTFLRRVAREANEKGFDTEIYYCGFDKNSLDMVIVPELDFCVFDSTAPHEMFPKSERDTILDFYEESGLLGTDEKYEKELLDVETRYNQKMAEGMAFLRLFKLYMKEREYYLAKHLNEKEFLMLKDAVIKEVFQN
ncbi:MAG: hypothetical protein IJ304_06300 [Clostridia bacterium]|nr:hypothetical protein [Clostridia bacterium]